MIDSNICCFTGHRKIDEYDARYLRKVLEQAIEKQYLSGIRVFRAGGAMGFDTFSALAIIEFRKKHPDVELELCLPCRDQADRWSFSYKKLYNGVLSKADRVRYAYDRYVNGCMLVRNRMLVDGSRSCIAYYNGDSGGTGYTYAYAAKKGLELINLYDIIRENKIG